jgi:hypothetical protein
VRSLSVMSHATTLHQILLRLKARGFHLPDGDTKGRTFPYLLLFASRRFR